MAGVVGIGGVFLKVRDLAATRGWYARVLGVDLGAHGAMFPPLPPGGLTILGPFPQDTGYFAPSDAPVMLNLVVDDLDAVLARVRGEGVEVLDAKEEPYGRFAWILDPDGIKLELWQAAPDPAPGPGPGPGPAAG